MFESCLSLVWVLFESGLSLVWVLFESCLSHVWVWFESGLSLVWVSCLSLVWVLFESCLSLVWVLFESCLSLVWVLFESCLSLVWEYQRCPEFVGHQMRLGFIDSCSGSGSALICSPIISWRWTRKKERIRKLDFWGRFLISPLGANFDP
jgi:hypothetical protein